MLYLTNIPLIIFIYNLRGRVFGEAMQDAITKNTVTPELRAAFRDPVVAAAHGYEMLTILLIIVLMVMKPF